MKTPTKDNKRNWEALSNANLMHAEIAGEISILLSIYKVQTNGGILKRGVLNFTLRLYLALIAGALHDVFKRQSSDSDYSVLLSRAKLRRTHATHHSGRATHRNNVRRLTSCQLTWRSCEAQSSLSLTSKCDIIRLVRNSHRSHPMALNVSQEVLAYIYSLCGYVRFSFGRKCTYYALPRWAHRCKPYTVSKAYILRVAIATQTVYSLSSRSVSTMRIRVPFTQGWIPPNCTCYGLL